MDEFRKVLFGLIKSEQSKCMVALHYGLVFMACGCQIGHCYHFILDFRWRKLERLRVLCSSLKKTGGWDHPDAFLLPLPIPTPWDHTHHIFRLLKINDEALSDNIYPLGPIQFLSFISVSHDRCQITSFKVSHNPKTGTMNANCNSNIT